MMVHPIFTYLVGLLCAEGLRIPDNSGLDPDDGENPALSGWTEMDGILARAFEDQGGNNWSKTSKPVQSYVDTQTFCRTSPMVNVILPRYDGINADMDLHREYSVTDSSPPAAEAGTCTSVDDLLRAVKLGRRVWKHGRADEKKPSHFVTKGCAVPQFDPTVFQRVLSTQSSIGLRGDSLTRHLMMGLTLRYTDNYYDGGMSHASSQWANCTCDGQFSEAVICQMLARIHPDVDKLRWDKGVKKQRAGKMVCRPCTGCREELITEATRRSFLVCFFIRLSAESSNTNLRAHRVHSFSSRDLMLNPAR